MDALDKQKKLSNPLALNLKDQDIQAAVVVTPGPVLTKKKTFQDYFSFTKEDKG